MYVRVEGQEAVVAEHQVPVPLQRSQHKDFFWFLGVDFTFQILVLHVELQAHLKIHKIHFCVFVCVFSLSDPMDCSIPGFSSMEFSIKVME